MTIGKNMMRSMSLSPRHGPSLQLNVGVYSQMSDRPATIVYILLNQPAPIIATRAFTHQDREKLFAVGICYHFLEMCAQRMVIISPRACTVS